MPEQRTKTRPIKAQSTAIARAMARICNAERVRFGVVSGHGRKALSLSVLYSQRLMAQEGQRTVAPLQITALQRLVLARAEVKQRIQR